MFLYTSDNNWLFCLLEAHICNSMAFCASFQVSGAPDSRLLGPGSQRETTKAWTLLCLVHTTFTHFRLLFLLPRCSGWLSASSVSASKEVFLFFYLKHFVPCLFCKVTKKKRVERERPRDAGSPPLVALEPRWHGRDLRWRQRWCGCGWCVLCKLRCCLLPCTSHCCLQLHTLAQTYHMCTLMLLSKC